MENNFYDTVEGTVEESARQYWSKKVLPPLTGATCQHDAQQAHV